MCPRAFANAFCPGCTSAREAAEPAARLRNSRRVHKLFIAIPSMSLFCRDVSFCEYFSLAGIIAHDTQSRSPMRLPCRCMGSSTIPLNKDSHRKRCENQNARIQGTSREISSRCHGRNSYWNYCCSSPGMHRVRQDMRRPHSIRTDGLRSISIGSSSRTKRNRFVRSGIGFSRCLQGCAGIAASS